jgi:hypothetical protein
MPFRIQLTARAERDLRALSVVLKKHAAAVIGRLAAGDPSLDTKKLKGRSEIRIG